MRLFKNFFHIKVFIVIVSAITIVLAKPGKPVSDSDTGSLIGHIIDQETKEPLGWTTMYIERLNRSISAHEDGSFHFYNLPEGEYELQVFRVGYHEQHIHISVISGETSDITILMDAEALYGQAIVVESEITSLTTEIGKAKMHVSGRKLRQNLGRTIAETIDYEPGLSQRTMGPAPARPVLRGMGGDRLLVLEDGQRTGDLSGASPDHAVAVESATSDRIEVIRGPEAITYGSNTLAGVVNVGRDYTLSQAPHRTTGSVSLQGETVNSGYAPAFSLTLPIDNFSIKTDGSLRRASDISTPQGNLDNTSINTLNGAIGIGYHQDWGSIGISYGYFKSEYGIPGLPDSTNQTDAPGIHPDGVNIDMERKNQQIKSEIYPGLSWINRILLHYTRNIYYHAEYETKGDIGMEFGTITHTLDSRLHLPDRESFKKGQVGVWMNYRDYASGGLSFTPNTKENSMAIFYYQEYRLKRFSANLSLRWDYKKVDPNNKEYSPILEGNIRQRQFDDFSGGIAFQYMLYKKLQVGLSFIRTFRAPGVEELYSEGPHLAAYSYEIGNPILGNENGFGSEISAGWEGKRFSAQIALYRNYINGYIFPKNTGKRSWQRNDLYVYRYVGEDAMFYGGEASFEWHFYHHFKTSGTLSYVHGDLTELKEPIPRIPPVEGKLRLFHDHDGILFGGAIKAANKQNRVGEFESPTDAYVVFDLFGQYHFSSGKLFHTFSLSIENLGNVEYYKHLNRIKEITPEPGRNFKLLYKMYF